MSEDDNMTVPHHVIIGLDIDKGVIIKDVTCLYEKRLGQVIDYINNILLIIKQAPLLPEDEENYYQGVLKEVLEICDIQKGVSE